MTVDAALLAQFTALDTATVSDALDTSVFARAQVPVTARGRLQQRSVGAPVSLAAVTVEPGDVVLADEGGIAVVPRARASEVLAAARRLSAREAEIEAEVRAGVPPPQAMRDARLAGSEA